MRPCRSWQWNFSTRALVGWRHSLLRDFDATAVGVVFPRMVGADDTIVFDPAEGEGGATVDAEVLHGVGVPSSVRQMTRGSSRSLELWACRP